MYYKMSLRSVRLDEETEEALGRVCRATGASVSEVIKQGIVTLATRLARRAGPRPFDIYSQLDLGPGGYARAPARKAKQAVSQLIREDLKRKRRR